MFFSNIADVMLVELKANRQPQISAVDQNDSYSFKPVRSRRHILLVLTYTSCDLPVMCRRLFGLYNVFFTNRHITRMGGPKRNVYFIGLFTYCYIFDVRNPFDKNYISAIQCPNNRSAFGGGLKIMSTTFSKNVGNLKKYCKLLRQYYL